jgi:uncharacterized protein YfaS (alpha-2-macroglobulin family)
MAFSIKQNDTGPSLLATLKDANDVPVNITGADVRFHMKSLEGVVKIDSDMTVVNSADGLVRYDWLVGDTDTFGTYYVEFEVTYVDGSVETFPNTGSLVVSVVKELN